MDFATLLKDYWWVLLILAAVLIFKDSIPWGSLFGGLKTAFVKDASTGEVSQADAMAAYNTLGKYLVKCPEGKEQLEKVWPHLEPSHVHAAEPLTPGVAK